MLFAALFFGHMTLGYLLHFVYAWDISGVVLTVTLSLGALSLALEKYRPTASSVQNQPEDWWRHGFMALVESLSRYGVLALVAFVASPALASKYQSLFLLHLWPHQAPLWLQCVLMFHVSTFCTYWMHRWMHTLPWLWPTHRLHHLPRHLTWPLQFWVHPLHLLLTSLATVLPFFLFDVSQEVAFFTVLVTICVSNLNHSNFRTGSTWLNTLFPSINEHGLHHARHMDVSKHNYGVGYLFWDHAFGTYLSPQTVAENFPLGVAGHAPSQKGHPLRVLIKEVVWPF